MVVIDVLRRPLPGGGRMAVESVAGCPLNGWPNQRGISGRIIVESPAEWAWNTQSTQTTSAIRSALTWLQPPCSVISVYRGISPWVMTIQGAC